MRTIALEEHFWTAELASPPGTGPVQFVVPAGNTPWLKVSS